MTKNFALWSDYDDADVWDYECLNEMREAIKEADNNNYIVAFIGYQVWRGDHYEDRRTYKVMRYSELFSTFSHKCDYARWEYEDGDVTSKQTDHDGSFICAYRLLRKNVRSEWIDDQLGYKKHWTEKWINRYTMKLGNKVLIDLGWWSKRDILKCERAERKAKAEAEEKEAA